MHVCAYVRVSSASQNVATQQQAITQAARARGDTSVRWYVEHMTGGTTKRPELTRLREDVRKGHVKRLYIHRLDRLTRTGIRDTLELVDEIARAGCALVTLADGFDFTGPAGELLLAMAAWAAKIERAAIGERISAARKRIESQGGKWGRPGRMTAAQIKQARLLSRQGKSVRSIAIALKVPRSTVYRALSPKEATNAGIPARMGKRGP